MTSSADSPPTQPSRHESAERFALREAMMDERRAYEVMRDLVPDLVLPRELRRPLDERQQAAVDDYHRLRERLESLRNARRSPALTLVP